MAQDIVMFGDEGTGLTQDSAASFFDTEVKAAIPDDVAEMRSRKYDTALGQDSPGRQVLKEAVVNGTDTFERQRAQSRKFVNDSSNRLRLVEQYIATRPQGQIKEEEVNYLRNLSDKELAKAQMDPEVYFEKQFSEKVLDTYFDKADFNNAEDGLKFYEEKAKVRDVFSDHLTRKEVFQKIIEDQEVKYKDSSNVQFTGNILGQLLIPFYGQAQTQNLTGKVSSILSGNNIEEQLTNLWLLPPSEAAKTLKLAIAELEAVDPTLAIQFARAAMSYGSTDQLIDNISTVFDSTVVGAGLARGARALLKGSSGTRGLDEIANVSASGDIERAALSETLVQMDGAIKGSGQRSSWNEVKNFTQSLINPEQYLSSVPHSMHSARATMLLAQLSKQGNELLRTTLLDPFKIIRQEGRVQTEAFRQAEEIINLQYPQISNTVLSVTPVRQADNLLDVDTLEIAIGTKGAGLFQNAAGARVAGEELYGLKNFEVKQQGNGYYISITKDVDETSTNALRQLAIETANDTNKSTVNMLLGAVRSKDYVLSKKIVGDAKLATFGGSNAVSTFRRVYKDSISGLGTKSKNDLFSFMELQRDSETFSNSLGKFEKDWLTHTGKLPKEEEALAYFTFRQFNDIDYTINNLNMYRDKARVGLEMHGMELGNLKMKKPLLEGKVIDSFPHADGNDARILLQRADGSYEMYYKRFLSETRLNSFFPNGGHKIIQLSPEGQRVLRQTDSITGVGQAPVDFVITAHKSYQTTPLPVLQVPYREGGHRLVDSPFYIRQAQITNVDRGALGMVNYYQGDRNLLAINSFKQGEKFTERLEKARTLLAKGDADGLRKYVQTSGLPFSLQEFKDLFRKGGFDVNQPFHVTQSDVSVKDAKGLGSSIANLVDGRESPYNLYANTNMRFVQEKGDPLSAVVETGSKQNPQFNLRQAKLIDPTVAITRNAAMLAASRQMDNLKFDATNRFIAEFADTLDLGGKPITNPLKVIIEGNFRKDFTDRNKLAAAKNSRRALMELLNHKSEVSQTKDWTFSKLADSMYSVFGQKGADLGAEHLLGNVKDPVKFARQIAFHSKLGLFNPKQLFVQAQGFVHISAIEGVTNAVPAAGAGSLMRRLLVNPDHLDDFAKKARAFGWTEKEFKESYDGLVRSGFHNVAGEVAYLDDFLDTNIVSNKLGSFLESGTVFFREGERFVRHTAWNAAYKKWRKENPDAVFDSVAERNVLMRADDLSVNMSRASNASWQHGLLSLPTQFFSYQARLAEQFLGTKLTNAEKARAFATYSAVYGLPVGLTAPIGIWPIHEEIRKHLLENGVDTDVNMVSKTLNDGLLSVMLESATGEKFAAGERLGPGGISTFKDLFMGDRTFQEIVTGVAGQTLGGYITTASPAIASTLKVFEPNGITLAREDWDKLLDNVSTWSAGSKFYTALMTQEYLSKQGAVLADDISKSAAVINLLTGVDTRGVADSWLKIESNKEWTAHKKKAEEEASRLYRLGLKSDVEAEMAAFFKQAHGVLTISGMNHVEINKVMSRVLQESKTLVDKVDDKFNNMTPERRERYIQKLQKELGIN